MTDDLAIGLLSTRIRSGDAEHAQALAGQVRQLADRQLARAFDGAGERALARARLPAGAVVAVHALDLRLKVSADVPAGELAAGWAAAFEAGLARLLAAIPPGDVDQDAPAAWFADVWAAERRHLERRATGQPDAWWAPDLAGDDDSPDPLAPAAILQRWLRRNPARALAALADLARSEAAAPALLTPDEATRLTHRLIDRFSPPATPPAGPVPSAAPAGPTAAAGAPPALPPWLPQHLARLAQRHRALIAGSSPAQAAPWLAALLLTEQPSASQLPAATLRRAIAHLAGPATPAPPNTRPSPQAATASPPPDAATPPTATPAPALAVDALAPSLTPSHPINAAGLLLLLQPLARLGLLPPPDRLGPALGDLALAALRRALAPLPPGERAVAEERERPLLAVFAPECDWRERIALIPVSDPPAALRLLDALIDAIPADIAPAPGGLRQVFGPHPAAFPTAADSRLASLLLRPGHLHVTPWDAELAWPLAGIDLALRRAGWDQDPGWLPWLGRAIRFRFGDPT